MKKIICREIHQNSKSPPNKTPEWHAMLGFWVCLLFGELHSWETDILAWLGWWFERLVWI
jgi:hypothetical protein